MNLNLIQYSVGTSGFVSTLTAGLCVSVYSQKHIPSFIDNAKEIKSKGVSDIIVISGLWLANALSWLYALPYLDFYMAVIKFYNDSVRNLYSSHVV